jgi:hypothetical protein
MKRAENQHYDVKGLRTFTLIDSILYLQMMGDSTYTESIKVLGM